MFGLGKVDSPSATKSTVEEIGSVINRREGQVTYIFVMYMSVLRDECESVEVDSQLVAPKKREIFSELIVK